MFGVLGVKLWSSHSFHAVLLSDFEAGVDDVDVWSGTGEGNLVEAEALLEPYQQKYPKVSWAHGKSRDYQET